MPRKRKNELLAGIFVLLALVVLVGVILFLGASDALLPVGSKAVFFSPTSAGNIGLVEGGDVKMGDMVIGRIETIVPDADKKRIFYHIIIDKPGYEIHTDAKAKVSAGLIGGGVMVVTSLGSPEKPETDEKNPILITGGLGEIIDNMKQISITLRNELDAKRPDALLSKVKTTIGNLSVSIEHIKQFIESNHDSLDEMVDNMVAVSANLKAASKEIRRNPWRLLYQPDAEKVHSMNIFDAARAFDSGATALNRAVMKLKILSKLDVKDPAMMKEVQRIQKHIQESFEEFRKVEEKLWEELETKK